MPEIRPHSDGKIGAFVAPVAEDDCMLVRLLTMQPSITVVSAVVDNAGAVSCARLEPDQIVSRGFRDRNQRIRMTIGVGIGDATIEQLCFAVLLRMGYIPEIMDDRDTWNSCRQHWYDGCSREEDIRRMCVYGPSQLVLLKKES